MVKPIAVGDRNDQSNRHSTCPRETDNTATVVDFEENGKGCTDSTRSGSIAGAGPATTAVQVLPPPLFRPRRERVVEGALAGGALFDSDDGAALVDVDQRHVEPRAGGWIGILSLTGMIDSTFREQIRNTLLINFTIDKYEMKTYSRIVIWRLWLW
jgi:hypothetical protein